MRSCSDPRERTLPALVHKTRTAANVPRDRLIRLKVCANICPQVLLRVLGLISQHAYVPFTIAAKRRPRTQIFIIEMEGPSDQRAAILLAKVKSIIMVRSASLSRPRALEARSVGKI